MNVCELPTELHSLKPINDKSKRTRYRLLTWNLNTAKNILKIFRKNWILFEKRLIETKVPRWGAREFAKHHVANGNHISVCRLRRHCPEHILWTRYNAHLWHGGKYSTRKIKKKTKNQNKPNKNYKLLKYTKKKSSYYEKNNQNENQNQQ